MGVVPEVAVAEVVVVVVVVVATDHFR